MAARDLYFDESGFTGTALLDPAQPEFVVASTDYSPEEASEILRAAFPRYKAAEFKFQAVWRRETHRAGIPQFVEAIAEDPTRVFTWSVNKRFCVLTKFVDALIEPLIHQTGHDFYAGGYAPRYCNFLFAALHAEGGSELYRAVTDHYATFARAPSAAALRLLQWRLHVMAESVPPAIRWLFEFAALGADRFQQFHDLNAFDDSFEIQASCVIASIVHWRSITADDFHVKHDASRNFFSQAEMWAQITSNEVPEQVHPGGNGPPMQFPLRVIETSPRDSVEEPSIQLCDILAGLVAKAIRPDQQEDQLLGALRAGSLGELRSDGIRPYGEMPEGPPPLLDGPDMVDLLAQVMYPNGNSPPA